MVNNLGQHISIEGAAWALDWTEEEKATAFILAFQDDALKILYTLIEGTQQSYRRL